MKDFGKMLVVIAIFLLPLLCLAQIAVAVTENEVPSKVDPGLFTIALSHLALFFAALKSGNCYEVLIVLCNMGVALLKQPWIEKKIAWLLRQDLHLGKRTKVLLTLFVGIGLAYFLFPSSTGIRTIGRGLKVGLMAMGVYTLFKHFIRKDKKIEIEA